MVDIVKMRVIGDFTNSKAWLLPNGGPAPSGLERGAYKIPGGGGVMSKDALPAQPGQLFVVEYAVMKIRSPGNKKSPRFVVGPVFFDASHQPIAWGVVEQPLTGETRETIVGLAAPAGATRAHIYLGGMWDEAQPHPDGTLAYTRASLLAL